MTMSAMQYQKQLDRAGDLSNAAERAEQECRETLLELRRWEFPERVSFYAVKWRSVGAADVTEAMYDLRHDQLAKAFGEMLDSDPMESQRIIQEARKVAVEDVLGRMDFEGIVKDQNQEGIAA